jgi:thiol-disulfide isomerase/thioredoxin
VRVLAVSPGFSPGPQQCYVRFEETSVDAQKLLVVAVLSSPVSCGGARAPEPVSVPSDARQVKVSLFDIDCAECAAKVVAEIKRDGVVYRSSFDKRRAVLDVAVGPTITGDRVIAAARRAGFRAEIGDGGGAYAKDVEAPAGADVTTVGADGKDITSLSSVAVSGKITIVDFYAEWCGPCREVDKHVKELLNTRGDIAYRRLDVVDWDSPLAAHYMKNVSSLPYVVVLDGKGAQVDAISGLDLPRLDTAIARARP